MKKLKNLFILSFLFITVTGNTQISRLESPYYIFPRSGSQHIDLSADWLLSSKENPVANPGELASSEWFNVAYPTSVQMANYKAGKMGDPYKNMNAREHEKLEQKVWYYKKGFTLKEAKGNNILLVFDGIDYFARVWLNGELLGTHEGIFGGPAIDITEKARLAGDNELVVEVRSANYGTPKFNPNVPGKIVKGWFLTGGTAMEPYFNLGLWRNVRIEIVPPIHIERPFLHTKSIRDNKALIGMTLEIFSGKNSLKYQLHPWGNTALSNPLFTQKANQARKVKDQISVVIELKNNGITAFRKEFLPVPSEGRCWLEEEFTLDNPELWYPNGMGNPHLYKASVALQVNGQPADRIEFDFGVRTIEHARSAGIRTSDRWHDWQFVINGKRIFMKGINWMPVDALYDLTAEKYDWAVRTAKNAGIQIFRIWGSGLLENREFYDACNKYGIMVWQDFNIANFDTPEWPQEVWEAQVCQNIFRLRNQPSLAIWCGGNEFNPYSYGNAASMGILERNLAIFDPSRRFLRASPDAGSIHTYPDFDPSWYKRSGLIPYVAETGIHCITDPKTIREVVAAEELTDLRGMYEKNFAGSHPEFVNHFAEYSPSRVPRMLSRASHIDNTANPTIESLAEATQVGAGEFYQVMSEGFQSKYPVITGLMPWVFKRPWPVVAAINLVDGNGQPSAPYYFLKRTYQPTRISLDIARLLWAPGEKFPLGIKVMNGVDRPGFYGTAEVTIMDHQFNVLRKESKSLYIKAGTSVSETEMEPFLIPEETREKYFFVVARLFDASGDLVSAADYWPRTIRLMEEKEYYDKFISEPVVWPTLDKGPWLKPTVAKSKTAIEVTGVKAGKFENNVGTLTFTVTNKGKYPSFMTSFEIEGCRRTFFATDNYFWLDPGDSRKIVLTLRIREEVLPGKISLIAQSWNAKTQVAEVIL